MTINEYKNYLIDYVSKSVKKTKKSGVVLGISGGVDSAVVACIAKLACQNNVICVSLPCESSAIDYACTNELVYKFFLNYKKIDLTEAYLDILKSTQKAGIELTDYEKGNIKARLRMVALYAVANKFNYLVLGTSNRSEYELGYFTKYGDGAADIYPIIGIHKSNVYKIARIFKIPEIILERKPTASLIKNKEVFDEDELGFSYEDYEKFLTKPTKFNKTIANKIKHKQENSNHKRKLYQFPKNF